MKKIIYTIIIFITLACTAEAQWVSQPLPFGVDVYDMKFFDANTGLISAHDQANGYVFRTTNGGNNWVIIANKYIFTLQKITDSIIYGNGRKWNVDEAIFRTFDRGLNWDSVGINSNAVYRGISFVNKDTGWVSGFDGNISRIWKTTNGGLSLTSIPLPGSIGWGKIFFLKYKINGEYYGWCSEYGDMWKTTNSGVNWFLCGSAGNLHQIEMINERIGWASNASTNILKTINGGLNWINQPMPTGNGIWWRQIKNFRIIDSNIVYGDYGTRDISPGNAKGIIWKTTNGGLNWGFQQPDTNLVWNYYEGLDFLDANTGWSSNIHTTNGGGPLIIVDVKNNISHTPKTFTISQNYPNPFNNSTIINYQLSIKAKIIIIVYNIMGKEVSTLVNIIQSAGIYKTTFDTKDLPSGIYFYSLFVDNVRIDTKRMTYLK